MIAAAPRWTTPADIIGKLRRRWDAGELLADLLTQDPWPPIQLPIRGPVARDLAAEYDAVSRWRSGWAPAAQRPWRVVETAVGGRHAGVNTVPARVFIDEPRVLWQVLGVRPVVDAFLDRVERAKRDTPRLVDWMTLHSPRVIAAGDTWELLIATVRWIDRCSRPGQYLRQLDVAGVDTKFVETHRAVLADLLDLQLDPARIDISYGRGEFEARYGFVRKPQYIRFRPVDDDPRFGGLAEVSLRAADFMMARPAGTRVVIIENDISYLAAPNPADTLVVFGSGYALSSLGAAEWLRDREIVYWGDIDTHGFVILDRLRRHWPDTRSVLMDQPTLLAHRGQWVREPTPVAAMLAHLTAEEAELYRELVEDTYGDSVRLEQERIRFSLVQGALTPPPRSGRATAGDG